MPSVLVVGGYGGIGEALTRKLTAQSRSVIVAGRSIERAQALASETGQRALAWNAREERGWQDAMEELDRAGVIWDAVVNLCGSILIKPIGSMRAEELQETFEQNFMTAYWTVKFAAPRLAAQGGGSIVLMSSVAARFGLANHEAIASAKAAVEGLVVASAASFAGKNVRINAVAPSLVETSLSQRFLGSDEARKASAQMHPLGRVGQPQDIAAVIATLVDSECSWMTGQVLAVDGGLGQMKSRR